MRTDYSDYLFFIHFSFKKRRADYSDNFEYSAADSDYSLFLFFGKIRAEASKFSGVDSDYLFLYSFKKIRADYLFFYFEKKKNRLFGLLRILGLETDKSFL